MKKDLNLEELIIGYADARTDIVAFSEAFLVTKSFERIHKPLCNIITGKKGTGKTAYLLKLKDMYKKNNHKIIEIVDDEISTYQEIFMKTIEMGNETFAQIATTYKTIWENIILEKVFIEICQEKSFHESPYRDDVNNFFASTHTSKIMDTLKAVITGNDNDKFKNSSAGVSAKFLVEITDRDKNYKKAKEGLRQYLSTEYSNKLLVLIDDLDKYIIRDLDPVSRKSLIYSCRGLYFAIKDLTTITYSEKLHIKACLPLAIYNIVIESFDADKMQAHVEIISVNKNEIRDILNSRISIGRKNQVRNKLVKKEYEFGYELTSKEYEEIDKEVKQYIKENGISISEHALSSLFENNTIDAYFYNFKAPQGFLERERDIFDVIYEFTFSTPRDMISIYTEIFKATVEDEEVKISNKNILQGIKSWSEEYLRFYTNEASFSEAKIDTTIGSFNGLKQTYSYDEFFKVLKKKNSASKSIQSVEDTISHLYNLGFIGRGRRKATASASTKNVTNYDIDFYYEHKITVNISMLKQADLLIIHPSFIYSLGLSSINNSPLSNSK